MVLLTGLCVAADEDLSGVLNARHLDSLAAPFHCNSGIITFNGRMFHR